MEENILWENQNLFLRYALVCILLFMCEFAENKRIL